MPHMGPGHAPSGSRKEVENDTLSELWLHLRLQAVLLLRPMSQQE